MTTKEFFEQDFSDLEGKEVAFVDSYGMEYPCIVAGCDPNVGITLVSEENHELVRFCMHGPSSPYFKKYDNAIEEHIACFEHVVSSIKDGNKVIFSEVDEIGDEVTGVHRVCDAWRMSLFRINNFTKYRRL